MSTLKELLQDVPVEWKALGDVLKIKNGKDYKEFKTGKIPVYGSGGIMNYIDTYVFNQPSVLIPRKGSLKNLFYVNEPFWTVDTIFWTDINLDIVNPKFVYYYLKTQKLEELNMAGGVPSLTQTVLNKLPFPIPYPNDPEKSLAIQQEIVRVLDGLSEKNKALTAALAKEIENRKKQYEHYREKLFRFEGKEVEWRKISEIGTFQRGKRFIRTDMISEGVPCIHYGEMYTHYGTWAKQAKSFLSEELVTAKKLRAADKGDVVLVAAGETIEDIGKGTAWLGDEGVILHDACFTYKSSLNPIYFAYFTRTVLFHDQIRKNISSGKISAINEKGFSNVIIPAPQGDEQERIVRLLNQFDEATKKIITELHREIELRRKQYEYYRNLLLSFPEG
ncbi:restriction endonuclease subunit S [Sphingobacterium psychroaquaticum]|uniref:restriction endonuclease subunit S n=1 Tax=Sphingobacterium psychroaquaticum TaxID=561061 RepID=UPI00106ABB52|nr:restriction endonuclease subunit S [Sphingobacterium psychroaquaticum]QBQ41269.1 restriction endonuclease subunit S [Sphingobacterium psychroaquaticum]